MFNVAAVLALSFLVPAAHSAIVYGGIQSIAIPTVFGGIHLNINDGAASGSAFAGWDIKPFFGGAGIANSPLFSPHASARRMTIHIRRCLLARSSMAH